MRTRTGLAGLMLAGCALLAGGCGGHAVPKPKPPAVSADASAAVLLAAAEPLHTTGYRFTTDAAGITGQGAADPVAKTVTVTTNSSISVRYVGGEFYLQYPKGLPGADALGDGKWLHLDPSKISLDQIGVQDITDPTGAYGYLRLVDKVRKVGDRYEGTLDLTKSGHAPKIAESMGDSAKAVPFAATVDDQGRLATLEVTVKVNGSDVATHTTFSDYGTKVDVARPDDVAEAPATLYRIFNR